MSRITLAFRCFFRLIFKGQLPRDAVGFLPKEALQLEAAKPEGKKEPVKQAPEAVEPKKEPPRKEKPELDQELKQEQKKKADNVALQREGALAFLALLQREGRLIDFLRESLDGFADADIGAAARDVHRGCRKVLEEHLRLEAMMPGEEEDTVTVPKGFDPGEIRLIGEVKGEPPFKGVMRHHGWRAIEVKLPTLGDGVDRHVLAPAEIEIA